MIVAGGVGECCADGSDGSDCSSGSDWMMSVVIVAGVMIVSVSVIE
jgi:hypothetical protein